MLLVRRLGGAATSQFRDGKSGGKSAASAAEQLPKRPPTPQSLWPPIEAPQSLSSAKTTVVSLMLFAAASDFLKFPTSGVAQWLAYWAHSPKVRGSKPRSANAEKPGGQAGGAWVPKVVGSIPLGRLSSWVPAGRPDQNSSMVLCPAFWPQGSGFDPPWFVVGCAAPFGPACLPGLPLLPKLHLASPERRNRTPVCLHTPRVEV